MNEKNGNKLVNSFEEYKKLSSEEKDYYIYSTLLNVEKLHTRLDKRYASKMVEHLVFAFIGIILVGFVGALVLQVIPQATL